MGMNKNIESMKRVNFLVIIFIWLFCTANQCKSDDCHKTIFFVNNSSKDIYIYKVDYPYEVLFSNLFPNPYNQPNIYMVKSGEKNSNGLQDRECIDGTIKQGNMVVYVFDAEVLANYSWGVIGRDYMVLKTIRPTLEEMQRNNWTIYFED